ncbi:MAG: hypothetical protein B6242_15360 [Anaerolineaceae bacterium 4572_78]|nr:MAG: hypothetical protein B6242_15360 [Anaerolineaceae bacterium 4572_78]
MPVFSIPTSCTIYLDANIIIYSVEKIEPYWSILNPMWNAAQKANCQLVSSELLVLETLVKPIKDENDTLEKTFRELLLASKELQLLPINVMILGNAAQLLATQY